MFDFGTFDHLTFDQEPDTSIEVIVVVEDISGKWPPDWRHKKPPEHHRDRKTNLPLHYSDEARKIHKAAQTMSSLGGHARAAKLSSEERVKIATKAANARWK